MYKRKAWSEATLTSVLCELCSALILQQRVQSYFCVGAGTLLQQQCSQYALCSVLIIIIILWIMTNYLNTISSMYSKPKEWIIFYYHHHVSPCSKIPPMRWTAELRSERPILVFSNQQPAVRITTNNSRQHHLQNHHWYDNHHHPVEAWHWSQITGNSCES